MLGVGLVGFRSALAVDWLLLFAEACTYFPRSEAYRLALPSRPEPPEKSASHRGLTTARVKALACVELPQEFPNSPTELFCYPSIGPQPTVPTFVCAAGWATDWRKECDKRRYGS